MSTRQKLENQEYIPKEWEHVDCPVCNSKQSKRYERFGNKWQYTYVLCLDCKTTYLSPRPKYDDQFVYDAYEFYAEEDERFDLQGTNFFESENIGSQDELNEIITFDTERTAFLDVGCAMGKFLYLAKKSYPTCYGLEVSSKMADFVEQKLNIKVFRDKFAQLETDQKFSCIYISHVIEHIPNPNAWIEKAKSLLTPNGILVIAVPNMFSLSRKVKLFFKYIRLRKGKWEAWRTPDHLYEPTLAGMQKLFEMNHMKILSSSSYSRNNMIPNTFLGKLIHKKFYWGSNLRFIVKAN